MHIQSYVTRSSSRYKRVRRSRPSEVTMRGGISYTTGVSCSLDSGGGSILFPFSSTRYFILIGIGVEETNSLLIHLVNRYLRIYYTLRSSKRIHPDEIHVLSSNIKFSLFFSRNKLALTNKLKLLSRNGNTRIVALRLTQKLNS